MFILSDRVKETSSSVGTGSVTLTGAYASFQSFNDGIGNGNETYYAIENNSRWEVGKGVYTSSSNSLSRDTIFNSSAGGAKVNLEGISVVFCTLPASKATVKGLQGEVSLSGIYFQDGTFQNSASALAVGYRSFVNISSDFTLSNNDVVFLDTTNNPVNLFLPTAVDNGGKNFTVKFKSGSNSGVVIASGSQTIDGQNQLGLLFRYESYTLISDNSNWFII
jgi:hypothetical protein